MDWETDRVVECLLERRLAAGKRGVRGGMKRSPSVGKEGTSLKTHQPGESGLSPG